MRTYSIGIVVLQIWLLKWSDYWMIPCYSPSLQGKYPLWYILFTLPLMVKPVNQNSQPSPTEQKKKRQQKILDNQKARMAMVTHTTEEHVEMPEEFYRFEKLKEQIQIPNQPVSRFRWFSKKISTTKKAKLSKK